MRRHPPIPIPTLVTIALACGPALGQDALVPVEQGVGDVDPLEFSLRDLQTDFRVPSAFDRVFKVPGRDDLLMRIDGGMYAVFRQSAYSRTRLGAIPTIPSDTIFYIGPPTDDVLPPVSTDLGGGDEDPVVDDTTRIDTRADLRRPDRRVLHLIDRRLSPRITDAPDTERPVDSPTPTENRAERRRRRETPPGWRATSPRVTPEAAPAGTPEHPNVLAEPAYRAARVRLLLRRAVDAMREAERTRRQETPPAKAVRLSTQDS